MVTKKPKRSPEGLSTLDDFLAGEGTLEAFETTAIKEVLAWQLSQAMEEQKLSQRQLALRMQTSRTQISRLLNPKDGNVTISTLQRAAKEVGRTLKVELV